MNSDPQGAPEQTAPPTSSGLYTLTRSRRARYLAFSASRREARAWFRERAQRDHIKLEIPRGEKVPEKAAQPHGPFPKARTREQPPLEPARATAHWSVLRSLLGDKASQAAESAHIEPADPHIAAVLLFSIAGGVGKSTIAATLARALASHGERVLLVDATSTGVLPLAFGARERKRGVIRTFAPPAGRPEAPVQTITVGSAEPWGPNAFETDAMFELLQKQPAQPDRILIDVPTASQGAALRLLPLAPLILVPMLPDTHSAAALDSIETFFAAWMDGGQIAGPYYLLNQFDPALPRHKFEREALRARLGSRLIDFELRRDPAVADALAEGMTVIDFAPDSEAAADHRRLAEWLRTVSPPLSSLGSRRWTEQ